MWRLGMARRRLPLVVLLNLRVSMRKSCFESWIFICFHP